MRPLELATKRLREKSIEVIPTSIQDSVSNDHHKLSTPEVRIFSPETLPSFIYFESFSRNFESMVDGRSKLLYEF
jgi:hypothetical protein